MAAKHEELLLRVEAILFAGGKPLSVSEISEILSEPSRSALQKALAELD